MKKWGTVFMIIIFIAAASGCRKMRVPTHVEESDAPFTMTPTLTPAVSAGATTAIGNAEMTATAAAAIATLVYILDTPTIAGTIINQPTTTPTVTPITQICTIFGSNTTTGQFDDINAIAVDSSGNLYVGDNYYNNYEPRVQKFDQYGNFILSWGNFGNSAGQFGEITAIGTDSSGNVYVGDRYGSYPNEIRIQKFTPTGVYITEWGSYGNGNGEFYGVKGIVQNSLGNIVVADNYRVQIFTSDGTYLSQFGGGGTPAGSFGTVNAIALDSYDNIYVADENYDTPPVSRYMVHKFDSTGNHILSWGDAGSGDGEFENSIYCLAVDSSNNIFAGAGYYYDIQKFDSLGNFIKRFRTQDYYYYGSNRMAIDYADNIYLASETIVYKYAPQ